MSSENSGPGGSDCVISRASELHRPLRGDRVCGIRLRNRTRFRSGGVGITAPNQPHGDSCTGTLL